MRRGVVIFLGCTTIFLVLAVHQVWTLLELLFIKGLEDAILREELPPLGSEREDKRTHLIPKIIHQTYVNTSIPEVWKEAQASCLALHKEPEWEYKLWTDAMSVDFIASEYPDFLDTFKGYRFPIERADAVRYFVLDHYGGIYLDLDDGCARPMEPLLSYPAFVRKTSPTGISNDVMGAVPHHPFFRLVMNELHKYDRSWILPYITVMASTGPLFLSVIWRHYGDNGYNVGDGADGGRIRILFPELYQGSKWSFFTHYVGNSWHSNDSDLMFWMSRHWRLVTAFGFIVGFGLLFLGWVIYRRQFLAAPSDTLPTWKKRSVRQRIPFWAFWARRSAQREYEMINRHEP